MKNVRPLFAPTLFCGFMALLLLACKDGGGYLCQTPPPVLRLKLLDASGNNYLTPITAGTVTILYYNDRGYLTGPSMTVSTKDWLISTYDPISMSRKGNDTTQFQLKVDDKRLGTFQLKTYKNQEPCNGWDQASELRFNGQLTTYSSYSSTYSITIP